MMRAWIESEPELSFGKGNRHIDPKAGLSIFGPFVSEGQTGNMPGSINIAFIGPTNAVTLAEHWVRELNSYYAPGPGDNILFPQFPGFEEIFRSRLQVPTALKEVIPNRDVQRVLEISEDSKRVEETALLYTTRFEHFSSMSPQPNIIICAISKEMEDYCWSSSSHKKPKGQKKLDTQIKKLRDAGQLFLTDFDEDIVPIVTTPKYGLNLRSRIKAGAMRNGIPTQLLLETTLSGAKSVQPLGTLAWNFSVGLFYKSGGFPWRLAQIRERTCFVGISFYKEKAEKIDTMGTSVAQVFDNTGEGLIIKGGRIQLTDDRWAAPHMTREIASQLSQKICSAYKDRNLSLPDRIVFHKTSRFWTEEIEGLEANLDGNIQTEYLAIEQGDHRIVREGSYPPLRGTCLLLGPKEYLVYGIGYIPYLGTYPGPHVPNPLHIIDHKGESTPQRVCSELLSLTKLNWNTAQFCCGIPITINIARKVSSIMSELGDDAPIKPSYRFYM